MANSPQLNAVRTRFDKITNAIVHNVQDVASKAFSASLISQSNLQDATNEKNSASSRSIALVSQILSSIESKETNFDVFVTILRELPVTRDLADQIDECVNPRPQAKPAKVKPDEVLSQPDTQTATQMVQAEIQVPSAEIDRSRADLTDERADEDPSTVVRKQNLIVKSLCPCGKCSNEKYLNHQCPQMSKDRYPYLDMSGLDEAARIDVIARLDSDLDKICEQFANLVTTTCKSLVDQNLSPEIVTTSVFSIASCDSSAVHKPLTERQEEELMKASTIPQVFNSLRHNWSFFNYEILKHIVNSFGSDQDQENLQNYLTVFTEFCNRSAFEVPPHVYGIAGMAHGDLTDRRILAVKLTDRLDNTLKSVLNVSRKISKILGIPLSCLFLCRVDEGCLQLVFLIPSSTAEEVFPLNHETTTLLLEDGIKIVGIATFESSDSPELETAEITKLAYPGKGVTHLDKQDLVIGRSQAERQHDLTMLQTEIIKLNSKIHFLLSHLEYQKNGNY